jgi:hypothetical protein
VPQGALRKAPVPEEVFAGWWILALVLLILLTWWL